MTDQEVLRKTLNEIDRFGSRLAWGSYAVFAVLALVAWRQLRQASESADERELILASTMALAMTGLAGVFLLVLFIARMTRRILQAIEIAVRRD